MNTEEIIKHNKRAILDDNFMARCSAIDEFKDEKHLRNRFWLLWFILRTYYYELRTNRYHNKLLKDKRIWVKLDELSENSQLKWLTENNIDFESIWGIRQTAHYVIFRHEEDAMAYKLRWM